MKTYAKGDSIDILQINSMAITAIIRDAKVVSHEKDRMIFTIGRKRTPNYVILDKWVAILPAGSGFLCDIEVKDEKGRITFTGNAKFNLCHENPYQANQILMDNMEPGQLERVEFYKIENGHKVPMPLKGGDYAVS